MTLVYPHYFADPFVWRVGEEFFAVGTGRANLEPGQEPSGVFPLLTSRNLKEWRYVRHVLPRLEPGYGDTYWAPEVAEHKGSFYLYYSVGFSDRLHQLRVAASTAPDGPYEDAGEPLIDPFTMPFAIDAHPFRDDDGTWYLFYARDYIDDTGAKRVGTGLAVDRLETMTRLAHNEIQVARAVHDWQLFRDARVMYGRKFAWHTLEGPCVRKFAGKYFCLYSGGCWENDTYGVDYVLSENVAGPFLDEGPREGPRVLKTSSALTGPGHISLVKSSNPGTDYIVYHAWDESMTRREMHISLLEWTSAGPKILDYEI